MTSYPFDADKGLILVAAEISGPHGSTVLKLVLDTGASTSLVRKEALIDLGFDPENEIRRVRMMTGSSIIDVPLVVSTRFSSLGRHRFGFPVIAHTLPKGSGVDGLLGLDFLRGRTLTIVFPQGEISLD